MGIAASRTQASTWLILETAYRGSFGGGPEWNKEAGRRLLRLTSVETLVDCTTALAEAMKRCDRRLGCIVNRTFLYAYEHITILLQS